MSSAAFKMFLKLMSAWVR